MTTSDVEPELATLVERTRGAQVWRRVFHATNGVVIAAVLTWLPPPEAWVVPILLSASVGLLVLDAVRLTVPRANLLFFRAFTALASPREARGIASSTWYTIGIAAAVVLFPRAEAISGILVMALADPAASYIGRRWGRHPFLGGSMEGTSAFLLVGFVVLALRYPWPVAAATAALAALAERRSWPLDDNLAVPVTSAAVLTALTWWV